MPQTRRMFVAGGLAALVAAGPAAGQSDPATRSVVRQLGQQGFDVTEVRRTLLGRVRVLARRGDLEREIVFDPRNGAILRDFTSAPGGGPSIGRSAGDGDSAGNRASPDDDDDGNGSVSDDNDDDDDDGGGGGSLNDDDDDDDDDDHGGDDDDDDGDDDDDDD